MKKKPLLKIDKLLLIVTILLFIVGLVMIFSASNVTAYIKQGDSPYIYFIKQSLFLFVGFFIFLFIIHLNKSKFKFLFTIAFFAVLLSLGILLIYGKATNGASSWYNILGFGFQPSEFFKVFSIIWLSIIYDSKKGKLNNYVSCLTPVAFCVLGAGFIFLQPDLGTFIIYVGIIALMFFATPMKKEIKNKIFMISLGLIAVGSLILVTAGKSLINETQMARITEFSNPCSKFMTTGNQVCNGYIAINNGGLLGTGLGNSMQKYLYLPEPYTDFIFAIIMEELGLIPSIFIIIGIMVILYRIIMIGRKCYNNEGALICYGVAIYIFLHVLINLGGLFGIMPLTGVPLPFLSYGGSFTWSLIIALSVVQRIYIDTKIHEEELKKQNL